MRAKKSLGQNWLKSEAIAKLITRTAELTTTDTVLEIGPGTGFLTKSLLATGAKVIAIEKDNRLINLLQERFSAEIKSGKFILVHQDILDFLNFLNSETEKILTEKYKLVANIPYYLTGQILRNFLESKNQPEKMVLMLQDEVAKRIVAKNKKESLLSVSVKVYGEAKYVKKVPAKLFSPAPKVDSAVLLISNISKKNLAGISEEKFFKILKSGFASKRKMLRNNLTGISPEAFSLCQIAPTNRAEDLTLENWLCLAQN